MKNYVCLLMCAMFFIMSQSEVYSQFKAEWNNSWVGAYIEKDDVSLMGSGYGLLRKVKGSEWQQSSTGLPSGAPVTFAYLNGVFYTGIANAVYKSTDLGVSWSATNFPKGDICILEEHGGEIYAGYNDRQSVPENTIGLFKSSDGGNTCVDLTRNATGQFKWIWGMAIVDKFLFIATEGGVLRSDNTGETWVDVSENKDVSYVDARSMTAAGNDLLWSTSSFVYRSSDYGNTWHNVLDYSANAYAVSNENVFAAAVYLFYSNNRGESWNKLEEGLPTNTEVYNVHCSGGKLFACTSKGLYSMDISNGTGIDEQIAANAYSITLYHNTTENHCYIETAENETITGIEVVTSNGRVVQYLTPNANSYILNLNGLQSDVYFIAVRTNKAGKVFKILKIQ